MQQLKLVALGAAVATVINIAAAALAGTGVGGIFNLGENNTVDASTQLAGTADGVPQLKLTNNDAGSGQGVQGLHAAATGNGPGIVGRTVSASPNAAGAQGVVATSPAGAGSAGVRGINNDTSSNGYGVWGSHAGAGTGVYGTAAAQGAGSAGVRGSGPTYGVWGTGALGVYGNSGTGTGVFGVSSSGPGVAAFSTTGPAVRATAGNGTGTALVAQGTSEFTNTAKFSGDVLIGNGDIAGALSSCPRGAIAGLAQVPASPTFSAFYVSVNNSFKCSNGGSIRTVQAMRVATGNYCVKFPGVGSLAAPIGNVWGDNDDFLAIAEVPHGNTCGPAIGETARVYRVRIRDASNGGYDDTPFTIVLATW